jgi:adenylosuccinate synthase
MFVIILILHILAAASAVMKNLLNNPEIKLQEHVQNIYKYLSFRTIQDMTNIVVVGAYWGDEGKGKIVDFLARDAEWVVRFNGGDNAGHSIVINGKKFALHLIPSGVFHGAKVAIGPGVLVNPKGLLDEYDSLKRADYEPQLFIDARANVIMPYHMAIDEAREGTGKGVGSTKKGIGPCMEDAARRKTAITMADLVSDDLKDKLNIVIELKAHELKEYGIVNGSIDAYVKKVAAEYEEYGKRLRQFVIDNLAYRLSEAVKRGRVLIEGAQGTLLDLHHGTKPYQTSTNATAQAAFSLLGIDGRSFKKLVVAKAYPSRVGGGPFPTRLGSAEQVAKEEKEAALTENDIKGAIEGDEYLLGKVIRKRAQEYGTTTGRAREVGMPDLVALRYSAIINGLTGKDGWVISLIDVLGGLPVRMAVAYEKNGERRTTFPARLEGWKPVYDDMPIKWRELDNEEVKQICSEGYDALPQGIKDYCRKIVVATGVPIEIISLGSDREFTLVKDVRERTEAYLK